MKYRWQPAAGGRQQTQSVKCMAQIRGDVGSKTTSAPRDSGEAVGRRQRAADAKRRAQSAKWKQAATSGQPFDRLRVSGQAAADVKRKAQSAKWKQAAGSGQPFDRLRVSGQRTRSAWFDRLTTSGPLVLSLSKDAPCA